MPISIDRHAAQPLITAQPGGSIGQEQDASPLVSIAPMVVFQKNRVLGSDTVALLRQLQGG